MNVNKEEYLKELESNLKRYLSSGEIEDILRDYGEYFEDGRRQNKSDIEISAKLGSPVIIAQQFIEESGYTHEDELSKIKEKAVNSINTAKEKITESGIISRVCDKFREIMKGIGGAFKRMYEKVTVEKGNREIVNGRKSIAKGVWDKFWTLIMCLIILFIGFWIEMFVVGVLCGVGFLLLMGLGFALAGLIGTVVTVGVFSPFISAIGLFGSVFILCLCGFLGMLGIGIILLNFKLFKLAYNGLFGKNVNKEEKSNVQED